MKRWMMGCAALALTFGCDPEPTTMREDAGPDSGMERDTGGSLGCRPTQTECDGMCVTLTSNPLNCGSCGNECGLRETCDEGTCRSRASCDPGQIDCGEGCTDTSSDAAHCGRCGEACDDGETCVRGACTSATCEGSTPDRCDDICTDLQTDNKNCGSCGTGCSEAESCVSGTCEGACTDGTLCTVDEAPTCVDTDSDPAHCGACNSACDDGQRCVSGTCGCGADEETCGGSCVNTQADPAHCGGCGLACDEGATCAAGRCTCPTGTSECGGRCINTQTDGANCGGCGTTCGASETCVAGACEGSGGCPSGETECGGSCTDINTDNAHCGACGNACGADTACSAGACRPRNDLRADAEAITLPAGGGELELIGDTTGATTDVPTLTCTASGPNIWYRLDVPSRGALWLDTQGADYDTAIFVADESGEQVGDLCNDDCPCGGANDWGLFDSCTAQRVEAGTYYISVGAYDPEESGVFLLHVQFIAEGTNSFMYSTRLDGMGATPSTVTLPMSSASSEMCGGAATSENGEDVRWFVSCGGDATHTVSVCPEDGGSWTRTTDEGVNHDPVLYVRSGGTGMETVCHDDDFTVACQPAGGGPRFGARIVGHQAGRGVHAVYIDSRAADGGGGMTYQLGYNVPTLDFSE